MSPVEAIEAIRVILDVVDGEEHPPSVVEVPVEVLELAVYAYESLDEGRDALARQRADLARAQGELQRALRAAREYHPLGWPL